MEIPAFATRMSSFPWRLTMPSTAASTAFESATSKPCASAFPPLAAIASHDLSCGRFSLHVVDDHRGPLRGQRLAARAADAARAARDQGDPSA